MFFLQCCFREAAGVLNKTNDLNEALPEAVIREEGTGGNATTGRLSVVCRTCWERRGQLRNTHRHDENEQRHTLTVDAATRITKRKCTFVMKYKVVHAHTHNAHTHTNTHRYALPSSSPNTHTHTHTHTLTLSLVGHR